MNTSRIVVLGLAALAAGGAAFLARGLLGGGTSHSAAAPTPPPISTTEVMVAASDIAPGQKLTPELVRWQKWPATSVDPSFITGTNEPDTQAALKGTVVRSPVVAGQPLTTLNVIHADSASFMSATLMPGMRAVAIQVSISSVAGGFILPNDRVDLVLTQQMGDSKKYRSATILHDVRVLAIDQAAQQEPAKQEKAQKAVSDVKTATLELSPEQSEKVTRAQASGTLSLLLRPLVDNSADASGSARVAAARQRYKNTDSSDGGDVSVIRYGVMHTDTTAKGE